MLIFPAIDLLNGQAVRLYQGDYNKAESFGSNPAAFAQQFAQQGATHIHLVDLDGAKHGAPQNFEAARQIVQASGLFAEFGGGVRTEETVHQCFEAGIRRVILGTAALKDAAFTKKMLQTYGGSIAIGVDARDGRVAVEGWLSTSETDSFAFCKEMRALGAEYVIYTDIARDGTGKGSNLGAYSRLAEIDGLHITASGGVSSLQEIKELRAMGLYAAILGKALYAGTLHLGEAIETAQ